MVKEVVSGVGADAKRTDKNISERVAKIQREAKIENVPGGTYSQATQLQDLASGASTEMPQAVVGSTPGVPGASGSGDSTFTLGVATKQPVGGPADVSNAQLLKKVKTNKVKDIKEEEEE